MVSLNHNSTSQFSVLDKGKTVAQCLKYWETKVVNPAQIVRHTHYCIRHGKNHCHESNVVTTTLMPMTFITIDINANGFVSTVKTSMSTKLL